MAVVRAEAEAVNCGNDHKPRNQAAAATPRGHSRANLNLLPEIGPDSGLPRFWRRCNPWGETPIRKRSGPHRNGRDFVLPQPAVLTVPPNARPLPATKVAIRFLVGLMNGQAERPTVRVAPTAASEHGARSIPASSAIALCAACIASTLALRTRMSSAIFAPCGASRQAPHSLAARQSARAPAS
jgi:hypothetical protein